MVYRAQKIFRVTSFPLLAMAQTSSAQSQNDDRVNHCVPMKQSRLILGGSGEKEDREHLKREVLRNCGNACV